MRVLTGVGVMLLIGGGCGGTSGSGTGDKGSGKFVEALPGLVRGGVGSGCLCHC